MDPPLHTMTSSFGQGLGLFSPPKALIADAILNLTPSSDVTNALPQGALKLGSRLDFGTLGRRGTRKIGDLNSSSVSAVTVTLDSLCLINCLKLNAYPSEVQHQQKSFSYAIGISRDGQHWVELFNYRNYSCLAAQDLRFPTQAVRYTFTIMPWFHRAGKRGRNMEGY